MLESLGEEVRQCYEHAEECAGQARATEDEKLRTDYLRLEKGWLKLARSYELRQRLTLFINEGARRKNDLNQNIRPLAAENKKIMWQPVSIAPFDRDLELAVRDGGDLHALGFPCRRILGRMGQGCNQGAHRRQPNALAALVRLHVFHLREGLR